MKMVRHKYVVEMIEVLASKSKIFIVLELVTGGELFDKIVRAGKLGEEQTLFYLNQLVEGVEYCHKLGVCHRDLKPEASLSLSTSLFARTQSDSFAVCFRDCVVYCALLLEFVAGRSRRLEDQRLRLVFAVCG